MKSANIRTVGLYFLFLVFLPFTGYVYVAIRGGEQIINKELRAAMVFGLFLHVGLLFVLTRGKNRIPWCVMGIGSFFLYGIIVSIMRNSPDEYLSYVLRIASFVMIFWVSYSWARTSHEKWWRFFRNIIVGSAIIYIAQSFVDLAAGRALTMNGAVRLPGSVGSPPGYASICMVFLIANLYLLMKTRGNLYLSLSGLLVACSFLTGTRAIAVLCLACFIAAFVFYHRSIYVRATFLFLVAALTPFLIQWVSADTEIGSRIAIAVQDQANDTSTNFRVMILTTYFSKISASELIFGLGIGGFPGWFQAQTSIQDVGPHFEFLWALSELGLVGAAIYLLALFTGAWRVLFGHLRAVGRLDCAFTLILIFSQQIIFQFTNPLYFYQLCVPLLFFLGGMLGAAAQTKNSLDLRVSEAPIS